tara:strand:- start:96 stop:260 length:165 start_codon:yes stop_codon:yes gene_type:complete
MTRPVKMVVDVAAGVVVVVEAAEAAIKTNSRSTWIQMTSDYVRDEVTPRAARRR